MNDRRGSLYVYPDVGRFGLAHSLLAWGRSRLWARRNGAEPLAPDWLRLRIGPYLRRERDKRNYFLLFQSGNAIGGLRKRALLASLPRIDERDVDRLAPHASGKSAVIVFKSMPDNDIRADFGALRGSSDFLRRELKAMTRPSYRPLPAIGGHIAVHVRLGDFAYGTDEQLRAGVQNVRLPMGWYLEAIDSVRTALGADIPIKVYSDGSNEELGPLLSLPAVSRSTARASITDMLSIADATALIGSGSGFSLWGSYLGQVPRISYPGQLLVSVLDEPAQEISLATGAPLPTEFTTVLKAKLISANCGTSG